MSKAGKVLLIGGALFWLALYIFRLAYGGWHPALWVPLVLGSLLIIGGLAKDWRGIFEFFTMRTTKEGMNMGAVILLALVGLTCVNVLSVKYNHKFDWTSDKINSLTDQSVKVTKDLQAPVKFVLLYRDDDPGGTGALTQIKDMISMYENVSDKVSFATINAIVDPIAAKDYDYSAGPYALFAVQGPRKLKVEQSRANQITEEGVTHALIKLAHASRKIVYFVTGHGERELEGTDADGLSFLDKQLAVTYDVRSLTLYSSGNKVPADAAVVCVIRPMSQFLESEIHALREYVEVQHGHLFIAIDPGMKQNLTGLAKSFGIEFHNDYVLDLRSQTISQGPATIMGTNYPDQTDITKAFGEGQFALFHIASSLGKAPDMPQDTKVKGIISTDARSMATSELGRVEYKPNGPHTIGMISTSGPAEVVVFGDSDFLSNRLIQQNLNDDLAQNIVSELANDKDLISIRPRTAHGTKLEMTRQNFDVYILCFLLPVPILMFLLGGFVWWRRKTA